MGRQQMPRLAQRHAEGVSLDDVGVERIVADDVGGLAAQRAVYHAAADAGLFHARPEKGGGAHHGHAHPAAAVELHQALGHLLAHAALAAAWLAGADFAEGEVAAAVAVDVVGQDDAHILAFHRRRDAGRQRRKLGGPLPVGRRRAYVQHGGLVQQRCQPGRIAGVAGDGRPLAGLAAAAVEHQRHDALFVETGGDTEAQCAGAEDEMFALIHDDS